MAKFTKGARVSGAEREQLAATLIKSYKKGASLRELAELTGRSEGFVH
jgi:Helix-turn-helix domain